MNTQNNTTIPEQCKQQGVGVRSIDGQCGLPDGVWPEVVRTLSVAGDQAALLWNSEKRIISLALWGL